MSKVVNIQTAISIIGNETFIELVEKCSGQILYLPKNYNGQYPNRKSRDESIRSDYHGGLEAADLAVKYDLSKSRIYKIIESK